MTILPRRNDGGGTNYRRSTKRQPILSVYTDDSNASNAGDRDSEEIITLREILRSIKRRRFSSPKSVTLANSNVLDCPTCLYPLKKPIYQCKNGHLACSLCCKKRNKRCSFCECHIGDIRCIAMEKVIEASIVPCPNAKYGCDETTTYSNQSSHEKCFFVPCFCPVPNCNYVGSYMDLKSHASSAHSWDEDVIPLVFDRPTTFSMDLGKRKMVVFMEEKEGDLFVVQAFKGSKGVYVTVNRIAPMTLEIPYISCSLAKLGNISTVRIGLIVPKIQNVREQMHPEDYVMWIPPKMLNKAELWNMKICIGNGFKCSNT